MSNYDPLTTNLDDLRFQKDLVDEARKRIIRYCPEWTEYNVSDPGITLIELFAWMTEQMIYRLNLVPRKNYIKFLEMLGMGQLEPPEPATTELTFYLSTPFPLRPDDPPTLQPVARIPRRQQVAAAVESTEPIFFSTNNEIRISQPILFALHTSLEKTNHITAKTNKLSIISGTSSKWDYFYLGFRPNDVALESTRTEKLSDEQKVEIVSISGYVLRIYFEGDKAEGVGINRNDPPWVWRACTKAAQIYDEIEEELSPKQHLRLDNTRFNNGRNTDHLQWSLIRVGTASEEHDTTGGFNNSQGSVTLYLPLDMAITTMDGESGYWIRCGLRTGEGYYKESPELLVNKIRVEVIGATVRATNAVTVEEEVIGESNGDAGQAFQLRHFPILVRDTAPNDPDEREVLEVEELKQEVSTNGMKDSSQKAIRKQFMEWQRVKDFSLSSPFDRHYTLNLGTGEICFGPAVRQSNGSVRQYGRIPGLGMKIRMKHYRYSKGSRGNVPAYQIRVLPNSVPYIDRVTNLKRVSNGRDQETLEEAILRAQRMMRAQNRAVTADDYELLARQDDRSIARVKCIAPQDLTAPNRMPPGQVQIVLIPAAFEAIQHNDFSALKLSQSLIRIVRQRLESVRLLTSSVDVCEPDYLGIFVDAEIVVNQRYIPSKVIASVNQILREHISPLQPSLRVGDFSSTPDDPDRVTLVIKRNSDPNAIRQEFEKALRHIGLDDRTTSADNPTLEPSQYLSPDRAEMEWNGWGFGQALKKADIYAWIQDVPGVRHVVKVDIYKLLFGKGSIFDIIPPLQVLDPASLDQTPKRQAVETEATQLQEIIYRWELAKDSDTTITPSRVLCSPRDHRITAVEL